MQVDVLELVVEALFGGRSVDNGWNPNHPLLHKLQSESGMSPEEWLQKALQTSSQETPTDSMPDIPARFADVSIPYTKMKDYVSEENYAEFSRLKEAEDKAVNELRKCARVVAKEAARHPYLSNLSSCSWGDSLTYNKGYFKGRIAMSEITE